MIPADSHGRSMATGDTSPQLCRMIRLARTLLATLLLTACVTHAPETAPSGFVRSRTTGERVRALALYPGVTATIVAPARIDTTQRVDLILYALPNGNSTAETMGRRFSGAPGSVGWRYDIQHIGAATRALRERGMPQAIVVYLEAEGKSWPEWRRVQGYEVANPRIVRMVDQIRDAIGNPRDLHVTLTGHSGGGSFAWGFIDGQDSLPSWLDRIGFLDSNYSFEPRHGERIASWLRRDSSNMLVVLAYDDREIMLDGKRVVSDSGGTWRATGRMIEALNPMFPLQRDTLGEFIRHRAPGIELLLHPNPANRILHTEMIGEMNGYMHAMLTGRAEYAAGSTVLEPKRAYTKYIVDSVKTVAATPPDIPARRAGAMSGSAFMASIASLDRAPREAQVLRELLAGNIPSFLRTYRAVTVTSTGPDSIRHTVSYDVMPDYLAIGSDSDFARIPMTPATAQAFCDAFGCVLPTRKMVNDIWAAATTHVEPRPLTEAREASPTFLQHDRIIAEQLRGAPRGAFVAGHKKDVVVSNKLAERADRVAIYGWHYLTGLPIQPLYTGHVDWYVDYSHGIRPVRRTVHVDGISRSYESVLRDPLLAHLLSDEGPIAAPRYPDKTSQPTPSK